MMKDKIKEEIRSWVENFVREYAEEHNIKNMWRTPLVGFADVNSPYIRKLPEIVVKEHYMPEKFMEDPTVVISYFIPFTQEVGRSNGKSEDNRASKLWSDAYANTNHMMAELNEALVQYVSGLGFRAVAPTGIGMRHDVLKSNWSHRHIARAAGLGTFGLNNMLITKRGGAGRYNSVISDIPVTPDMPLEEENCLYKKMGGCKKCVGNCFSGALTTEGFNRFQCLDMCNINEEILGEGVCGKCAANVPCSFSVPGKREE